ncbi:ATP-binding protein [Actinomadura madurae]|uniref:ATP-binding protein n=1 Tax=Actinomadura madurae TaxID=1993 RepID=UPI0020273E7F|nr:ATP-binding protein [Actinomadura madurae]URM97125.1 ATP-binding protein [Actinomadura madurae]
MTNVLANAIRHGAHPVHVEVDGPTITIRDHGPGFPDDLLQEGPTRFRKGSTETPGGHGLGLTIAKGQAAVLGATLTLTNPPHGGAQVAIHLPDRP